MPHRASTSVHVLHTARWLCFLLGIVNYLAIAERDPDESQGALQAEDEEQASEQLVSTLPNPDDSTMDPVFYRSRSQAAMAAHYKDEVQDHVEEARDAATDTHLNMKDYSQRLDELNDQLKDYTSKQSAFHSKVRSYFRDSEPLRLTKLKQGYDSGADATMTCPADRPHRQGDSMICCNIDDDTDSGTERTTSVCCTMGPSKNDDQMPSCTEEDVIGPHDAARIPEAQRCPPDKPFPFQESICCSIGPDVTAQNTRCSIEDTFNAEACDKCLPANVCPPDHPIAKEFDNGEDDMAGTRTYKCCHVRHGRDDTDDELGSSCQECPTWKTTAQVACNHWDGGKLNEDGDCARDSPLYMYCCGDKAEDQPLENDPMCPQCILDGNVCGAV